MELAHKVKSIEEVLKGTGKNLKVYNIGFIQNFDVTRKNVFAKTVKEAKLKFANANRVCVSGYIVARHHNAASLNDHDPIR